MFRVFWQKGGIGKLIINEIEAYTYKEIPGVLEDICRGLEDGYISDIIYHADINEFYINNMKEINLEVEVYLDERGLPVEELVKNGLFTIKSLRSAFVFTAIRQVIYNSGEI